MGETEDALASRLITAMGMRGYDQKTAARACGVTEAAMSRIVNGKRKPRADTVRRLCRGLGVSADWLLGIEGREGAGNGTD